MNIKNFSPYFYFLLALLLILSPVIILALGLWSTVLVYSYNINITLSAVIVILAIGVNFLMLGYSTLKSSPKTRSSSKKPAIYLLLMMFSSVLSLIFFCLFLIQDFILVFDDIGLSLMILLNLLIIGLNTLLLYSSASGLKIYLKNSSPSQKSENSILQNRKDSSITRIHSIVYNYIHHRDKLISTQKIQVLGVLSVLILSGVTFLITSLIFPRENWAIMGFSDPAYDLPEGPHYNSKLDNDTYIDQDILSSLEKGLWAITKIQQRGGFPMWVEEDGSHYYSDRGFHWPLFPGEFSLQGGTALLGELYLSMYQIENNSAYLEVAKDAADALVAVQDEINGGFFYDGRRYEDGTGYQPHPRNYKRATILDDNVMQSSLDFLLEIYNETRDRDYLGAIEKGFDCLDDIEKENGGWPQRSNYPDDCYSSYVTLNDNAMRDVMFLLFKAHNIFPDNDRYLDAAKRCGKYLISVQGNGGNDDQKGWAQQYNHEDQPAWARAFEPPAICSWQTKSAMECLLELYLLTNNTKWLEPIPKAIEWLDDSTIEYEENGEEIEGWARLYELNTNKPIYGIEFGKGSFQPYVYDYGQARPGYSWRGDYGISAFISRFESLKSHDYNITAFLEEEKSTMPDLSSALSNAENYAELQTDDGFWLTDGYISDGACAAACNAMMDYLRLALDQF